MKIQKKIILITTVFSLLSLTFANEQQEQTAQNEQQEQIEKTEQVDQDEYSDIPPSEENEKETTTTTTTKQKFESENPIKDFFFGKEKYIFFDKTNLWTGTVGFDIKPRFADVILEPKTQQAGIQVYYQTAFFNILFDTQNRALITESLDKYLSDFDNKKLVRNKSQKTRRIYTQKGKTHLEWGTVKIMMHAFGDTRFHCGYEFKKNNGKTTPYFCIIIEKCKNVNDKIGTNKSQESTEIQLYFTKSQAKKLVELLGRESINNQLAEYLQFEKQTEETFVPTPADEY